jgi:uncharacterized membrane protein YcfT
MKERLEWIDALKGISIILVVFYHVILYPYSVPFKIEVFERSLFDSVNYFLAYNLAPLRMPLFFMISGFLVHSAVCYKKWSEVLHSRIGIYIYVFMLWAAIQNILVGSMGGEFESTLKNSIYADGFTDFILLTIKGASSLWYLYALAVFFVVTKAFKCTPVPLLLFAIVLNVSTVFVSLVFPYKGMVYCFLFFVIGAFWGKFIFKGIEGLSVRINSILTILGLFIFIVGRSFDYRLKVFESIFFIYFLTFIIIYLYKMKAPLGMFSYIGRNTLPIYIIHKPLIEFFMLFIIPWTLSVPLMNEKNHLLYSIIVPLSITLFCMIFSIVFWKMTNVSFGRYLYGYRFS